MADISPQGIPDFGQLLSSYGQNQANIGLTQAQTGLTGANTNLARAQTGLVGMQARKAGLEVQMIQQALAALKDMPTGQDEQSGENSSSTDPTETGIASTLNKKFYVNPMGPPGVQQYINATAWVNPAEAQRAEEMRKLMVNAQTSRNQNEANDIFQTASALADKNPNLQSLLSTRPGSFLYNTGKAIQGLPDKTPEEKDEMAANAVRAAAKYSHQYTGREKEQAGDEYRDKTTGFPIFAPKIGPTAGEQIGLGQWLNTPQTVTIDNRDTTIKPKDLGIRNYNDIVGNKSIKFSNPPPGTPNAQHPNIVASTAQTPPAAKGGPTIPGLTQEQSDFVKSQPNVPGPPKSNQKLNAQDIQLSSKYNEQRAALAQEAGLNTKQAQDKLTDVKRISSVLQSNPTLGPGSSEWAKVKTFMNQWLGTPVGEADSYQILSKYLNADQMNTLLGKFHKEGAQVRLGAYESRLIMEQLSANPNMTREAIQQMLKWQASDANYELNKARTASALITSGKAVENFDTNYGRAFPRQDQVDTEKTNPYRQKLPNFSAASGKTFTQAEVNEAARHYNIPPSAFAKHLIEAGATVQ
jgi:hypothetical protein